MIVPAHWPLAPPDQQQSNTSQSRAGKESNWADNSIIEDSLLSDYTVNIKRVYCELCLVKVEAKRVKIGTQYYVWYT